MWRLATIFSFARTGSGGTPLRDKSDRYYGGDIPWVKSGELADEVLVRTQESVTRAGIEESSAKVVPAGAVLVAMYGATVGKTALLGIDAATNQAVCHIVPDPRLAIAKYVWHALRARVRDLLSQRVGGAQPNISQEIIRNIKLPLPPPSEQRRIVEILDQADALRQLRAAADAKAERILPALFHKMFGDPATNPMRWPISKLGDRDITLEFRYGTSTKCEPEPHGFPVLRIPNVLKGEIDLADLKYANLSAAEVERLLLKRGDLLFVRTNGNREYVGRCAVFDLPERFLFASYLIRARLNPPKVDPWYVAAFLRSPAGRQQMSPVIRTTAGQSNISVEGLSSIEIPLPPIEHQHRFRSLIQELLGLRRQRESATAALQSAFDTLVHRAFSGDLTAKWREAHMQELLAEMEQQVRYLDGTGSDAGAASARLG